MIEEWRPVVGWEDRYEISSHGRVRSLSRTILRSNNRPLPIRGRILRDWATGDYGHRSVGLDGGVNRLVHRLVCEAFHGPAPEGKPLALHRNGVGSDNRQDNLYWGDQTDNMRDAKGHGTTGNPFQSGKTHCPQSHPYDERNTYRDPSGRRHCKECRRVEKRERRLRERSSS